MHDDIISVDRVTKFYGALAALEDVTLQVHQGEFLSLLGPSGSGKTTLLRIIAGFTAASAGVVSIAGRVMNAIPPYRRPVNTVFQSYALFPHMTVAANIAFGPRRAGLPRAEIASRVKEALASVSMEGYDERFPHSLSGGQQQRVALARAIINRPRVLLLDEPLGALDLKLRKRMQVELKRLHGRLGITFIYVTHDQEEALAMSDRIVVMSEGHVVQVGSGREIYRSPVSRYVADFIGEANLIRCSAEPAGGLRLAPGGAHLPYRSTDAAPTLMVRPEDVEVGDIAPEGVAALQGTLRDKVFIGQGWRLFIALAGDQEIVAEPRRGTELDRLDQGAPLAVWWPIEAGRILSR